MQIKKDDRTEIKSTAHSKYSFSSRSSCDAFISAISGVVSDTTIIYALPFACLKTARSAFSSSSVMSRYGRPSFP